VQWNKRVGNQKGGEEIIAGVFGWVGRDKQQRKQTAEDGRHQQYDVVEIKYDKIHDSSPMLFYCAHLCLTASVFSRGIL
jgi:hypothetical protein